MTTRERRLVWLLGLFAVGGLAFAAKSMVLDPLDAARERKRDLDAKLSDRKGELEAAQRSFARLKVAQKRSLPGNAEDAQREYPAALDRLARAAGAKGVTITPRPSSDTRSIPQITIPAGPAGPTSPAAAGGSAASAPTEKKIPAYAKVGFEIKMKKVDVPTVTRFLQGYYALNLLHQITTFDLKRSDTDAAVGARRGSSLSERSDMEVTIVTEAIILDGAERRGTLLSTPPSVGAVGGALAHAWVQVSPDAAAKLPPTKFVDVLATMGRDYAAMPVRDPFHGPLPKPPEKTVEVVRPPDPPKVLPSIDKYVKLTAVTRRSDRTAVATIWDGISSNFYEVELRFRAESVGVKTRKTPVRAGVAQDSALFIDELVISEQGTSTDRTFKVLGLIDGDGMVVSEDAVVKPDEPKETPRGNPPRGGNQARGGPPTRAAKVDPKVSAVGAVVGGAYQPPPPKPATEERVYLWRAGESLADLKAVEKGKVAELIKRAGSPQAVADAVSTAGKVSKAD